METSSLLAEMTATASPAVAAPKSHKSPKSPKSPRNEKQLEHATASVESNQNHSLNADSEISKEENRTSTSEVSAQRNDNTIKSDHNHESSIKLKRCKHGRIIIKDLSKRKSAQHSDNDANIPRHKNESNNNHIIAETHHHKNENGVESKNIQSEVSEKLVPVVDQDLDTISHDNSFKSSSNQTRPHPRTPPIGPSEACPVDELAKKISSTNGTVKQGETHLSIRTRARSRSSSQSLSPQRDINKVRSPPRRSRGSLKKSRRDRSVSRDRSHGSSHRQNDSPSPKKHKRKRSSRGSNRKSSRRWRTPERHKNFESNSYRGRSPSSGSSRLLPRSRSTTPTRRRSDHRHDYRDDGRRRSKERSKYDKYQPSTRYDRPNDTYKKANHARSPEDRRPRPDASNSTVTDGYLPVVREDNHDNRPPSSRTPVAQPGSESSLAQVLIPHQPEQLKTQVVQPAASPKRSPTARSPATPSIDDSSSSDTYDPEAPVIPISPGDSPPISPATDNSLSKPTSRSKKNEKTGEDDVPSSAVQLNQQEKYLQKLNRQERVIEEVKVALRPFYQNRSITKEQYKDVLRRAVPKICHSKNGEINPVKIRGLVDAYVKKMKRQ